MPGARQFLRPLPLFSHERDAGVLLNTQTRCRMKETEGKAWMLHSSRLSVFALLLLNIIKLRRKGVPAKRERIEARNFAEEELPDSD